MPTGSTNSGKLPGAKNLATGLVLKPDVGQRGVDQRGVNQRNVDHGDVGQGNVGQGNVGQEDVGQRGVQNPEKALLEERVVDALNQKGDRNPEEKDGSGAPRSQQPVD